MKNNWGRRNQKGGDFQKESGKTQLFKLSLGIEKDKDWDT